MSLPLRLPPPTLIMSIMNKDSASLDSNTNRMQAEFDLLADEYRVQHKENIAITGESPEYFAEYKIADLAELLNRLILPTSKILDFGSGIGNSLPYFRKYFSSSEISCADVSARSIEIAQNRFPGQENYVQIDKNIPLSNSKPGCGLLRLRVSSHSARRPFVLVDRTAPNYQAMWDTCHL